MIGGRGRGIGAGAGAVVGIIGVLLTRGRPTVIYPESVLTFQIQAPVDIATDRAPQAFQYVNSQQDYGRYPAGRPPVGIVLQLRSRCSSSPAYGYASGYYPGYYPPYAYGYPYPYYGGFGVFIGGRGYYGRGYYGGYRGGFRR